MSSLHVALEPGRYGARGLEAALRTAVRTGRLPSGARLPSTRALADDLGVARATVTEAYAQLQAEGFLIARRGAGTWVGELVPAGRPDRSRSGEERKSPRFSFNPGVPDLTAFPRNAWTRALGEGLRVVDASALGYGDPRGRPELRDALAEYLTRARGVVASPDHVVVCAGFSHALSLAARTLRTRGVRAIAMEDPCLSWHREIVSATGAEIVSLEVDERGARTDVLAQTSAGAVVVAPAHQFPLGCVLAPERRTAAVAWASRTGGVVIEDDYDAELRYDRTPIGALQSLAPEHVIFAGTLSKTLAPGLRLGWMVVPEALIDQIVALRRHEGLHVAATEQIAFARFLASGGFERHTRRMRNRYRRRRERLTAALTQRLPAVRLIGISAGLRVLLELPPSSVPADTIAQRAAEASIELFPVGPCYHSGHSPTGREGLVLGYAALPEHDFDQALTALGDLLSIAP